MLEAEESDSLIIPTETGIQICPSENREPEIWIPAFAGMTGLKNR
jgi:hypothetical protein